MWIAIAIAMYLLGMVMYDDFVTNAGDIRRRDLNAVGWASYVFWPVVAVAVFISLFVEHYRKPDYLGGPIIPGPKREWGPDSPGYDEMGQ